MKKIFFICASFLLFGNFVFCERIFAAEGGVALNIRFYDKRIYYPQDDEVFILLTITNNSSSPFRFRLSDDRIFSIDLKVKTLSNRAVPDADILVRKRSSSVQVYFREVLLESGESLSFVENLRNYTQLNDPGAYIVQAKLFPELLSTQDQSLESNRLSLYIKAPAILNETGIPVDLSEETESQLVRERLAPDDVISWTIRARQKSQWEKFFLYLDLEAMITRDAGRLRRWKTESEEGRRRMLARYRTELESAVIDGDIVTVPFEFQIERTTYNNDEGTVTVLEKFKTGDYTERKRYTYYLKRVDGIWSVIDYIVINLGTE